MDKYILSLIVVLAIFVLILLTGCSGAGFVAVGGSGAIYNPNNEHGPKIVQNQPIQSFTVGKANMLPMVGDE